MAQLSSTTTLAHHQQLLDIEALLQTTPPNEMRNPFLRAVKQALERQHEKIQ